MTSNATTAAAVAVRRPLSRLLPWGVGAIPAALYLISVDARSGAVGTTQQLAALLASGWLAVSLMLMVRNTAADQFFGGLDRFYRMHHLVGGTAFIVALAHPLLLAIQQWPATRVALGVADVEHVSGWITVLLFAAVLLATFSTRISIRTWRQAHAIGGTLAFLALAWHIGSVTAFSLQTASIVAWWLLFLAGIAALVYRFRFRDRAPHGRAYRIKSVQHPRERVVALTLEPAGTPGLRFEPGQHVYAAFVDSAGYRACGEYHPFTIASAPGTATLELLVTQAGACTARMQDMRPDVAVYLQGPYGGLFGRGQNTRPQIWIAGGVGIAPFLSRLRAPEGLPVPVDLYYAFRSKQDALYLEELEREAQRRPQLRLHTVPEDTAGRLSATAIKEKSGPVTDKEILLSGPPAMVRDLTEQFRQLGTPSSAIHHESLEVR